MNRNVTTLDSHNNNLNSGDIANAIDEPLANRQGQIKHLYRHFVFIFCRTLSENDGFFCIKAKDLSLPSGLSTHSNSPASGG